jgi:hypothetical protein
METYKRRKLFDDEDEEEETNCMEFIYNLL